MRNLEIKARYPDHDAARRHAERCGALLREILWQTDTYFRVPAGRLKLREIRRETPDGRRTAHAELIHYERADTPDMKASDYRLAAQPDARETKALLAGALGVRSVVVNRRELWWIEGTRIHLDEVEGLGRFLEFEVMVREGETEPERAAVLAELRRQFEIAEESLLAGSYSDLLPSAER